MSLITEPIRVGDLVRVQIIGDVYHAIVLGIDNSPPIAIFAVFLGNGLTVECEAWKVEPVPLHFRSLCTTSFAEILKTKGGKP